MQESHKRVQWVYESTNDKELEERYTQPMPALESEVQEFSMKVNEHLSKMGVNWA